MPNKILISFLGTGKYEPCNYCLEGSESQTVKSTFVSHVLHQSIKFDHVISLQTQEAKNENGSKFGDFTPPVKVKVIDIESLDGLESQYKIFNSFVQSLKDLDGEIYFDCTHGFRSFPMLAYTALIFLKYVHGKSIKGIYYGEFDFDKYKADKETIFPITNLVGILQLTDWAIGTYNFKRFGSFELLKNQFDPISGEIFQAHKDISIDDAHNNYNTFTKRTNILTNDLENIRAESVVDSLNSWKESLNKVKEDYSKTPKRYAIEEVVSILSADLINEDQEELYEGFKRDSFLINYYKDKKKYQKFLTILRESIVNYFKYDLKTNRKEAEDHVRKIFKDSKTNNTNLPINKLISMAPGLRNDINHAGFRKNPVTGTAIEKKIDDLYELWEKWVESIRKIANP